MRRVLAMLVLLGCGASPQARDEASITYHIKFTTEAAVNTLVAYPMPTGPDQMILMQGLTPSDGGTIKYVMRPEGLSCQLEALGDAEATWFAKNLKGFAESSGPPNVTLSMEQPDAGPAEHYLFMTKSGRAVANVEFEYTASRDCGNGCGGTRSWKFTGTVGMGRQDIHMDYVEEQR